MLPGCAQLADALRIPRKDDQCPYVDTWQHDEMEDGYIDPDYVFVDGTKYEVCSIMASHARLEQADDE